MCGRYAVTTDPAKLAAEIDAVNEVTSVGPDAASGTSADTDETSDQQGAEQPTLPGVDEKEKPRGPGPNYNVAPTTTIMSVVKRHSQDDPDDAAALRVRAMRWGLVPPWTKELGKGPLLFNARAETAAEKSSFRTAVKSKRCLIPMDGWYEWQKGAATDGGKPTKIPFFMSPKDGTRLFMAGLWSVWRPKDAPKDAAPLLSATILTTDAVGDLRDIHDRMPLIMPFENWDAWLNPDETAPEDLFAPPADDVAAAIEIREVAPLVNRVANNGPELLAPV
ncbi:SOS response-associated peptidase [Gordonia soli]|uniref:Abasic site processing protein n=1 Tax=Gordonia soli NBRC 108243 TaxID=1223545 RepID=M0QDW3_9ACTN|nr:SOS response-associated peptidase [Gordonia soli]GAC66634.1 hypothetical protein GS4_03_00820 [Gordonia soli NBRC 108243]